MRVACEPTTANYDDPLHRQFYKGVIWLLPKRIIVVCTVANGIGMQVMIPHCHLFFSILYAGHTEPLYVTPCQNFAPGRLKYQCVAIYYNFFPNAPSCIPHNQMIFTSTDLYQPFMFFLLAHVWYFISLMLAQLSIIRSKLVRIEVHYFIFLLFV